MKKLALIGLTIIALGIGSAPQLKNISKASEVRDATIIVKMKGDVEDVSYQSLINKQNRLLNDISNDVTSNYKVITRYSQIFNGFVLEVPSAYVSSIRYLNGVDKVNYKSIVAEESSAFDGVNYEISLGSSSSASAQTMEKPEGTNDGSKTFIAILDNGFYIQTADNGDQTFHHVFSPLNDEDVVITQESLKAKIDSAAGFHGKYDATHSTYYNNKVPFYYDYGGDQQGTVRPDFDVYAEGQDHGTHVASIAGGNAGEEYEGVAPKAQMALMKVFTTYMDGQTYRSGAYNDAILTALEDCLVLGVDSINMSLGSNLNDFDNNSILEETIKSLNNRGTFVNVAAGNDGKGQYSSTVYRYWQKDMVESGILGSHANNLSAMSVASCQADSQFYGEAFTLDGKNIQYHDEVTNYNSTSGKVEYNPERHLMDLYVENSSNEIEFVYTGGLGAPEDYDGLDMSGKLAVVNRGDITFREKVDNAYAAGAIAVGIINNTNETDFSIRMSFSKTTDATPYTPPIPVIFILQKDKDTFENAKSNKIVLLKNVTLPNPYARQISDYSSDGMRFDLAIKPEITTPGENIKGAVLGAVDKYESMSGTSMATPNYAGAVALMISNHIGDENYRKTINSRLMSTAQPMKDNTPDKVYTSVRRQGAGLVNLDAAINSKVYLDGIGADGQRLNKAKIELFNNDKIKEGKLDLSFKAINEGDAAVSYTAKTYVLAPALDEYSEEIYPEFAGQKFQTTNEQLVEVFTDTINVPAGETLINVKHDLSADKKATLDADFESGCVLEGFVILEATGAKQLSIPFLGYYGDLAKVSPVEPFDFERVGDSKIYNSDLLNYLVTKSIGTTDTADYSHADYTSRIVAGYWADQSKVSVNKALVQNTMGIKEITDGNGNRVKSVGMNPYTGELSADSLFVGNNGSANTMIIQQFVNRSVATNTLTLKNKATNEIVLTDHMFDNIMGSSTDPDTQEKTYPLYKSHFDSSFYDSGYMAHRAYSVVPLYSTEDGKQVNYPDGEYEMKFSYTLAAGSVYEVSYNLTIESNIPNLEGIEEVTNNGQSYYRFYYSDTNVAVVKVNEKAYAVSKDENGKCYADVPANLFTDSKVVLVNSIDSAFGEEKYMTHVGASDFVAAAHNVFISGYDFNYEIEGAGTNNQKYTFEFVKNGKTASISGAISYRMRVPAGLDINTLKVFTINARGTEKEISFTKKGDLIEFSNTIRVFRFTSDPVLMGITITAPSKIVYEAGDTINLDGLSVVANMSNGESQPLNLTDFNISPVDLSVAGEKTVTISYNGYTATFTITVNAKQSSSSSSSAPDSSSSSAIPSSSSAEESSSAPSSSSDSGEVNVKVGCGGSISVVSMTLAVAALGLIIVSLKKKHD